METFEVISANVVDPNGRQFYKTKANERARVVMKLCKNPDCALRKRGECIMEMHILDFTRCPYGKMKREEGYTFRAKQYYPWINEKREEFKDLPDVMKSAPERATVVGDWIWLPYRYLSIEGSPVPFKTYSGLFTSGDEWIPVKSFTPELVTKLSKWMPRAILTNSKLVEFHRRVFPSMLVHIKEDFPHIWDALDDEVKARLPKSAVGRKAYINTLSNGARVKIGIYHYIFDGEYWLFDHSTGKGAGIAPRGCESFEMKVRMRDDFTVEVTNDDQVDENTKFSK